MEYKKFNGLARIHMDAGDYDEARRLLLASIANFPHDPEAQRLLDTLPEGPGH